ncbi:hypothetical protein PVA44_06920 (plasmid) [Entomospira nematocerorum]|uniref:Uncharacterized protein n=1 Tax=Entomospira nematocerorum TaxID=2719987 RepID=A0A968GG53_9SPIO|nr:hypothetical protein [Entomospira nematocera]NIZ47638.1 hypothetical protein [Entomospira nematocera]WDI34642.1 hypothetical protein PVA44_06920 [Entomospira nematocera]
MSYIYRYLSLLSCMMILIIFPHRSLEAWELQTRLEADAFIQNRTPDLGWQVVGLVSARMAITHRTAQMRVEVTPEFTQIGLTSNFGFYRAFWRANFGSHFRMTLGKAPITWGRGYYYNTGDLFFSASSSGITLSSDNFRDNARWLLNFYIPLGRFSYIEVVGATGSGAGSIVSIDNTTGSVTPMQGDSFHYRNLAGGIRAQFQWLGVQTELATAYLGEKESLRHALTLSGGIAQTLDWYLGARYDWNPQQQIATKEKFELSMGFSLPWTFQNRQRLTVALESIIRPFGKWQRYADAGVEDYGAEIFAQLTYQPISIMSLTTRVVFSPVDLSSYIFGEVAFYPIQDLSIFLGVGAQVGSSEPAIFQQSNPNSISVYLRSTYTF